MRDIESAMGDDEDPCGAEIEGRQCFLELDHEGPHAFEGKDEAQPGICLVCGAPLSHPSQDVCQAPGGGMRSQCFLTLQARVHGAFDDHESSAEAIHARHPVSRLRR
jgi:hypothetical protein